MENYHFTPTSSALIGQPWLRSRTLRGTLQKDPDDLNPHIDIELTFGSGTIIGSGSWIFSSLPVLKYADLGHVFLSKPGRERRFGTAIYDQTRRELLPFCDNIGLDRTRPWTWHNDDQMRITLSVK